MLNNVFNTHGFITQRDALKKKKVTNETNSAKKLIV